MGYRFAIALATVVAVCGGARAQYFVIQPYLSSSDSPLLAGFIENFEDGALNTPGVVASTGNVLAPGPLTDSVDGDDGLIDGFGTRGRSWYLSTSSVTFTFDPVALGGYPTYAGLVWTDVGFSGEGFCFGTVRFEAFDTANQSLGVYSIGLRGDGRRSGETAEDTLFGIDHASGISSIRMSMLDSVDWEVDHLQYGAVPEPATLLALGAGVAAFLRGRRK